MFYYFNQIHLDEHQGDWELVQVGLAADGSPAVVTFSQHGHPDSHDWNTLEHETVDAVERCVVYPAFGSHAVYPKRRHFPWPSGLFDAWDHTDGAGRRVDPALVALEGIPTTWGGWPGVWGASRGHRGLADSPRAPRCQGERWDSPSAFATSGRGHVFETIIAPIVAVHEPPPPLSITARFEGDQVVVGYHVGVGAVETSTATSFVQVTLQPQARDALPYTKTVAATPPAAEVPLPAPVAGVGYRVVAAALGPKNEQSDRVSFDLAASDA
jgi:hypothetical protein